MAAGFVVKTGTTATALVAATAKTLVNLITGTRSLTLVELSIGFDGTTSTNTPVLVELCGSTQATAGTPGSSPAPTPIRPAGGDASIFTAAVDYTAEPTVLTPTKHWLLTPNGGLLVIQFPLGREYWTTTAAASAAKGLALRATAPQAVNARAYMEAEE